MQAWKNGLKNDDDDDDVDDSKISSKGWISWTLHSFLKMLTFPWPNKHDVESQPLIA